MLKSNKAPKKSLKANASATKKSLKTQSKRKMSAKVSKKVYTQQATEKLLASAQAAKTDVYAPAQFFQTYKSASLVIPQFQEVITHPLTTPERKKEVVADVFAHLGADKPTIEFFGQLAADNRLGLAKDALTKYRKMAADASKDSLATVTSAQPLTPAQIQTITKGLEQHAPKGFKLRVFTQVDPKIVSGFIVQMDTFYQDLSFSSAYQAVEQQVQDAAI
jgi:ATP synthase F1 delta subunit